MVESVPYWHFGDFLRAPVRHVNAALDVRVVSAGGGKTADGDDPRRNMRGIDADWRCGATGASFNKSAYQGDVFWCGYPDPRHFVNSVHSWVNHHSFFSTTSGRDNFTLAG